LDRKPNCYKSRGISKIHRQNGYSWCMGKNVYSITRSRACIFSHWRSIFFLSYGWWIMGMVRGLG